MYLNQDPDGFNLGEKSYYKLTLPESEEGRGVGPTISTPPFPRSSLYSFSG